MKASFLCNFAYQSPTYHADGWPVPPRQFEAEHGVATMTSALDLAERAEDLGFDWISVAEHHYSGFTLSPNPVVCAAAVTQRTTTARIAVLGPILPILNPVRVAEELAMVDNLSGGRLIAGPVRGTPNEFKTYGTNPDESRGRFEEGMALLLKAWAEPEPFAWEGTYWQFPTVAVWPRPVQQPHPPIMISGKSRESQELAARLRLKIGFFGTSLPDAAACVQTYRELAAAEGWTPAAEDVVYRAVIHVAETDERAHEQAGAYGMAAYTGIQGKPRTAPEPIDTARTVVLEKAPPFNGINMVGGPDTILDQVCYLREEVGAGVVDLVFLSNKLPRELGRASLDLFAKEVLPGIRHL